MVLDRQHEFMISYIVYQVRLEMVLKKKAILNVFKDKISEIIKKKLTNTNQNTDNVTGALKQMFARITNETSTLEQIYKVLSLNPQKNYFKHT